MLSWARMAKKRAEDNQQYLTTFEMDRRSLFVGNLPPTMTPDLLKSVLNFTGHIMDVRLIKKSVPNTRGKCPDHGPWMIGADISFRNHQLLRFCGV
jgi:RNA recognition motif-containing protein